MAQSSLREQVKKMQYSSSACYGIRAGSGLGNARLLFLFDINKHILYSV